ncbi:MAG: hypothetical protein E7342_03900 [Clostridiales bacterium]|nr:hypothetical protein [Clostridiales bacterium]
MKTFSFNFIFDLIFLFISSFFLFFIPLSFFIEEGVLILFCLLLSLLSTVLFIKISKNNTLKKAVRKKDKENLEKFTTYLLIQEKEKIFNLLTSLIEKKGFSVKREKDYLLVKNAVILINFEAKKTDLIKYANTFDKEIFIVSLKNEELTSYSKLFIKKITLVDEESLYLALKEENLLPTLPTFFKKKERLPLKEFLKTLNGKRLFFISLFLLFFSFFTPFKIYYLIFSFIFLSLFVTSLIIKRA